VNKDELLDRLIGAIYETALDSALWAKVLELMAEYLGAVKGHFFLWDKTANSPIFTAYWGFSEELNDLYNCYYGAIDPRRQLAATKDVGEWTSCHSHFDPRFVRHSEFYQDYLIPSGVRYVIGAKVDECADWSAMMGILRAPEQMPFGADELAAVKRIDGHLQRAIRLHQHTEELRVRSDLGARAIDALGLALFIVTGRGRICHINAAGEQLLNRPTEGLSVKAGCLRAEGFAERARLAELLKEATSVPGKGGAMFLARPSNLQVHQVFVAPLPASAELVRDWQEPLALALIVRGGQRPTPLRLAAELYRLTPAETRLAAALLKGDSPEEYAEAMGVRISTVRSQLRALFNKTGTRRQAELVALFMRMPSLAECTDASLLDR